MNPSAEDKLAIGSLAVEEWYKEYLNYSRLTNDWNGNILHNEQISHFLQVRKKFQISRIKLILLAELIISHGNLI